MNNIIRFPHPRVSCRIAGQDAISVCQEAPALCEYETFDEDARSAREHAEYWNEEYLEDAGYLP